MPRLQRGDAHLRVQVVRHRGDHRVHVAAGQQRLVVGVERDAVLRRRPARALVGVGVGEAPMHHVGDQAVGDELRVHGALGSEADDAEPDLAGHVLVGHGVPSVIGSGVAEVRRGRRSRGPRGCPGTSAGSRGVAAVLVVLLDEQVLRAGGDRLVDDLGPVEVALPDLAELHDTGEVLHEGGVVAGLQRLDGGRRQLADAVVLEVDEVDQTGVLLQGPDRDPCRRAAPSARRSPAAWWVPRRG